MCSGSCQPFAHSAQVMAEEAVLKGVKVEVNPKILISKNGIIGYEKVEGFQAMTNFDVSITGFVAESSGAVIGKLAEVRLDIIDDDAENDDAENDDAENDDAENDDAENDDAENTSR